MITKQPSDHQTAVAKATSEKAKKLRRPTTQFLPQELEFLKSVWVRGYLEGSFTIGYPTKALMNQMGIFLWRAKGYFKRSADDGTLDDYSADCIEAFSACRVLKSVSIDPDDALPFKVTMVSDMSKSKPVFAIAMTQMDSLNNPDVPENNTLQEPPNVP
jgi:hypothetical protein